ncbi:hypothetical protein CY35_11G081800 [Sphagnum magellanicum]|nr:hypothetical protein CY35_11G081800 [Sphagnum magellanicum]
MEQNNSSDMLTLRDHCRLLADFLQRSSWQNCLPSCQCCLMHLATKMQDSERWWSFVWLRSTSCWDRLLFHNLGSLSSTQL